MLLYDYLVSSYKEDEPIFLIDIKIEGMTNANLRQQIKKLTDDGRIKRFDTGIYFLPKKTLFQSGSQLSKDKVIEQKYLIEANKRCGYFGGIMFANQMGLTTQVPMAYEIVTNKATKDFGEISLAKSRVIIRKPRTEVTEENYKILQFLDLLKDVDVIVELTGKELEKRILRYMREAMLDFTMIQPFLKYYPDKIYRNMYETGILYGVSA